MDLDPVRLLLVLDTPPTETITWSPVTDRFHARLALHRFADGEPWDGQRVVRALIVEQAD